MRTCRTAHRAHHHCRFSYPYKYKFRIYSVFTTLNEEADKLATKGVKASQAGRGHNEAEMARRILQNDFSIPRHNIRDLTTLHYRTYLHHHRPP